MAIRNSSTLAIQSRLLSQNKFWEHIVYLRNDYQLEDQDPRTDNFYLAGLLLLCWPKCAIHLDHIDEVSYSKW